MSRPSLAATVTISPDVVFRELDGEMVILDLQSGTYFGLDDVGARAWSLMAEHGSLQAVFDTLHREYDVTAAVLEDDLLDLVTQLTVKGLARVSRASA